jgi:hypothetical protein
MDHDVHESTDGGESEPMPSEEPVHHESAAVQTGAESLPQPTEAVPRVQPTTSVPRRRQNTRHVAQRRRQRLQALLQHPASPPASP